MRIRGNQADEVPSNTFFEDGCQKFDEALRIPAGDDRILNVSSNTAHESQQKTTQREIIPTLMNRNLLNDGWEVGAHVVFVNANSPSFVPATITKKMESRDLFNKKRYRYNIELENGEMVWNVATWRLRTIQESSNSLGGGTVALPQVPSLNVDSPAAVEVPQSSERMDRDTKAGQVEKDDCKREEDFTEGTVVEINFQHKNVWYSGRVRCVNTDGSYDVCYDGGQHEVHLPAGQLRLQKATLSVSDGDTIPASLAVSNTGSVEVKPTISDPLESEYPVKLNTVTSLPTSATTQKWKRYWEVGASVIVLHLRTQLWWSGTITWASPLYDRYNVHLEDANVVITNVHAMIVDGPSYDTHRNLSRVYTEYVKWYSTRTVHTRTSHKVAKISTKASTARITTSTTPSTMAKDTSATTSAPQTKGPVPVYTTAAPGSATKGVVLVINEKMFVDIVLFLLIVIMVLLCLLIFPK